MYMYTLLIEVISYQILSYNSIVIDESINLLNCDNSEQPNISSHVYWYIYTLTFMLKVINYIEV